jgi:hypothetical protein
VEGAADCSSTPTCFINGNFAFSPNIILPLRSFFDAMEGDSDDEDRSTLDYARHHELCKPYDNGPVYDGSIPVLFDDDLDRDLWGPTNESIVNAVGALVKERIAVNREAGLLLRAVQELQQKAPDNRLTIDRYHWMSNLKQELPILRTDNELDLLHFGSAAMPKLKDANIPLEAIDQEKDEGLEWSAKYLTYTAQFDKQIKAEKLAVSRDVLLYLRDAIADEYTSEDYERIQEEDLQYKPVGEVSMPEDITKNVEYSSSASYSTFTTIVTPIDAVHTFVTSQPSPSALGQ